MQGKQWQCKNDHVLGYIILDGDGVSQLRLLRHAIDLLADTPEEVDWLGTLAGQMSVRCDVCGDVRIWHVSTKTALDLVARVDAERLAAFLGKLRERRTLNVES